ncbi:MAG: PorV/PorQ family protein [Schleiferiaceae bacterium]|nr:PorV/PorQ family protein [Schleiferiaceae bacterium]
MRILLTYFSIIALAYGVNAQLLPSYGGERAGQSAFPFLKNDLNVRSAGLAGASVALDGDAYSLGTNPAGIASLKSSSLALSQLGLAGGSQNMGVMLTLPRKGRDAAWGIAINHLQTPAFTERTEFQPGGTGYQLYSSQSAVGLSYAQRLSEQFQLGITLKGIGEVYTTGSQTGAYSAYTAAADVGFLYTTDVKDLRFAVVLRNFGGSSALRGQFLPVSYNRTPMEGLESNTLPTEFAMGLSLVPWASGKRQLLVAAQLVHPNDNAENYRLGLEYQFNNRLKARLGSRFNQRGQSWPMGGLSYDGGTMGPFGIRVDVAAQRTDAMGWRNTLGLVFTPQFAKP